MIRLALVALFCCGSDQNNSARLNQRVNQMSSRIDLKQSQIRSIGVDSQEDISDPQSTDITLIDRLIANYSTVINQQLLYYHGLVSPSQAQQRTMLLLETSARHFVDAKNKLDIVRGSVRVGLPQVVPFAVLENVYNEIGKAVLTLTCISNPSICTTPYDASSRTPFLPGSIHISI